MFVHKKQLQRGHIQFLTILKTNMLTILPTLYYIYVYNFNQNLKNCSLLIPQRMFVYCDLFYCCRR